MASEEAWVRVVTAFWDYNRPLENTTTFKYLGQILTSMGNGWPVVVVNLRKARKK